MQIACITCTGDRPEMLERSKFYLERSTQHAEWVVIDDGIVPFNPGGCTYLRREPDGPNSLARNLLYGLERTQADMYLFWEDDDWYAPTRIATQCAALRRHALHGWRNSIYYNIALRCWHAHMNTRHSSLFETGIREDLKSGIVAMLKASQNPFVDLRIWREYWAHGKIEKHDRQAIGIKGGPGRLGIGSGHRPSGYTPDDNYTDLKNIIGESDANWYVEVAKRCTQKSTPT